jgi:SAM-dependent methyltransferase
MDRRAAARIARSRIEVDRRSHRGESLPFKDESFDCVVCTWTLCSIPNVGAALGEVFRVLRAGGRFVFVEHGISDDPRVQRWQRRLNPLQRRIGAGCRLDLDVESAVRSHPFHQVDISRFVMEKSPRTHATMYAGRAVK